LLSAALSGDIHYLDARTDKAARTIYGHQKAITAMTAKSSDKTLFTGSYDGRTYAWSLEKGLAHSISGSGHTNQVSGLALSGDTVYSIGMDDSMRSINTTQHAFASTSVATDAVPLAVAAHKDVAIVTTIKDVQVVKGGKKEQTVQVEFKPTAVAISTNGSEVAIGGDDCKVHLFSLSGCTLTPKKTLEYNRGQITDLAYSPDGKYLAVADTDRKVLVYDAATGDLKFNQWVFHSARVNCVAWAPDSLHAVSGGLDRDVYVWSVEKPMKYIAIKGAHQDGVTGVRFVDNDTVVSTGHDANVKVWKVQHHA
jgi:WD40 repeat protein